MANLALEHKPTLKDPPLLSRNLGEGHAAQAGTSTKHFDGFAKCLLVQHENGIGGQATKENQSSVIASHDTQTRCAPPNASEPRNASTPLVGSCVAWTEGTSGKSYNTSLEHVPYWSSAKVAFHCSDKRARIWRKTTNKTRGRVAGNGVLEPWELKAHGTLCTYSCTDLQAISNALSIRATSSWGQ